MSIEQKYYLACQTALKKGEDLLLVDENIGVVVKYNLLNLTYDFIGIFPAGFYNIIGIFEENGNYYFVDRYSYTVIESDNDFSKFNFFGDKRLEFSSIQTRKAFKYRNKIFLIPRNINRPILIYDINQKIFSEKKIVNDGKMKDIISDEMYIFGCLFIKNEIWFCLQKTSFVFCMSMEHEKIFIYSVGKNIVIDNICKSDRGLWIITEKNIFLWNPKKGIINCYEESFFKYETSSVRISTVMEIKNGLICISPSNNFWGYIDLKKGDEIKIELHANIMKGSKSAFGELLDFENGWLLLPRLSSCFMNIKRTGEIIPINCEIKRERYLRYLAKKQIINECEMFTIIDFLKILS